MGLQRPRRSGEDLCRPPVRQPCLSGLYAPPDVRRPSARDAAEGQPADPNGTFNVGEYGTVNDPELFDALRAYSPYHNVQDGTAYPATLLTAGETDPFAKAYHAKKMAARLQAATSSSQPVLLRVRLGGHGPGSLDQRLSELADIYAFLFDRLSIDYRPPADRHPEDG